MTLWTLRRALYATARVLGDLHAAETGRIPQRIVRRAVYRHSNRAARRLCRWLGI